MAKLNDIDAQAWLADVLIRIDDHPATRLDELLPWNSAQRAAAIAAQVGLRRGLRRAAAVRG